MTDIWYMLREKNEKDDVCEVNRGMLGTQAEPLADTSSWPLSSGFLARGIILCTTSRRHS